MACGYDEAGHRVLVDVSDGTPRLVARSMSFRPTPNASDVLSTLAKLLRKDEELHRRIEVAYWAAPDQAGSATDGEAQLRRLVGELELDYPSAAAWGARWIRSSEGARCGRFPGETIRLSLCCADLDLFTASSRGLR